MSETPAAAIPSTGRLMGLDYGTKRIGIALSDGLRLAAHAHDVLSANAPDFDRRVTAIVEEYQVSAVIVGLPTSLGGTEGISARGARKLAMRVGDALAIPVTLYDERFTTRVAERTLLAADTSRKKRKQSIDKVAAAVMLQGFLDWHGPSS